MHRLQTVTDIGQSPGNDNAHGVIEISAFYLFIDFYIPDVACTHIVLNLLLILFNEIIAFAAVFGYIFG